MDQTPNLKLPYILPSQAQKHVTHYEALRLLDAVVHLSIKSQTGTDAPETPASGDRYLVAAPSAGHGPAKTERMPPLSMADGCSLRLLSAGRPMSRRKRNCSFSMTISGRVFHRSPTICPSQCWACRRRPMRSTGSRSRPMPACSTMLGQGTRSR